MAETCKCGKGAASRYDGKCGHCRTPREQKTHTFKVVRGLYPVQKYEAFVAAGF